MNLVEEEEDEDDDSALDNPGELGDFINDEVEADEEESSRSDDEEEEGGASLTCPIDRMPMSTFKNQETGAISVFCSDKTNCSLPWCPSGEIANMLFQIETKVFDCYKTANGGFRPTCLLHQSTACRLTSLSKKHKNPEMRGRFVWRCGEKEKETRCSFMLIADTDAASST